MRDSIHQAHIKLCSHASISGSARRFGMNEPYSSKLEVNPMVAKLYNRLIR
jgi:hypothetical protein